MRVLTLVTLVLSGCSSEPAFEEADLREIVLQPDEAPAGVRFESEGSGVADSYLRSQLAQPGEEWPPNGYEISYQHFFSMPPLDDPETVPTMRVRGVVSLAVLFDCPETASAFLQMGFPPESQLSVPGFETLGEERRGLVTETTGGLFIDEETRPRRTTIVWRRANLFLQLNVSGEYSLDEVMALAVSVDRRASETPVTVDEDTRSSRISAETSLDRTGKLDP
ncbi:MAG: hypothetical protein ACRD1T_15135 [Acidimicrobiia bacterium]